jgi:hypothetical protein
MVKEQIMLNGGVFTSMALSGADFVRFVDYKAAANGVFTAAQYIPADARMHAVFCYGWWDNPRSESDGYWLCKNRWAGVGGSSDLSFDFDVLRCCCTGMPTGDRLTNKVLSSAHICAKPQPKDGASMTGSNDSGCQSAELALANST